MPVADKPPRWSPLSKKVCPVFKARLPLALSAILAAAMGTAHAAAAQPPAPMSALVNQRWPVKVVIVTTYENGEDTGDRAGELQLWAEREKLTKRIEFPGGPHDLLTNDDHSVVAIVTGIGLVNAGASLMALALDPRFDVSKAYWLVAGIAGVDPEVGAIGDAAWANYVVNDFAISFDRKDAPADWPYGILPFRSTRPNQLPDVKMSFGPFDRYAQLFPLNQRLTKWAYELTKDTPLYYTPEVAEFEKPWTGFPEAQRPPKVMIGDSFASNYFWHGQTLTKWARDWVRLHSDGKARFVMSNTEDSAIAAAVARMGRMGVIKGDRLMVLRTASNYTMAHPGQSDYDSWRQEFPFDGAPAFEAAYRVGSRVVHEITDHWDRYEDQTPGAD